MSQRYRVLIPGGIEYPTSPSVIRRLQAGDNLGLHLRGHKRAEFGEIIEDHPSPAILVKKGWLEPVADEGDE